MGRYTVLQNTMTQEDVLGFAEIEIDGADPATEVKEDLTWLKEDGAWEEFKANRSEVGEAEEASLPADITEWLEKLNMFIALNWSAGDLKTTEKFHEMGERCLDLGLVPYFDKDAQKFQVGEIASMYTNVRIERNELGSTYLVKGDSERFGVDAILYESYIWVYCVDWIGKSMGGNG